MSIFWNHISDFFKKIGAIFTVTPTEDMRPSRSAMRMILGVLANKIVKFRK
ncbi:unnamed protein product [Brassica oleracea]